MTRSPTTPDPSIPRPAIPRPTAATSPHASLRSRGSTRPGAAVAAATLALASGVTVGATATPAEAWVTGCNGDTQRQADFYYSGFVIDTTPYLPQSRSCLELWGEGRRVDGLDSWFMFHGKIDHNPLIAYEMNFDYPDGHTDTITGPLLGPVTCDFTGPVVGVCGPPNNPAKFMTSGRFHWGDFRPDILGPNKGYNRVCGKVKRKDGLQNGQIVWGQDVTTYHCFNLR